MKPSYLYPNVIPRDSSMTFSMLFLPAYYRSRLSRFLSKFIELPDIVGLGANLGSTLACWFAYLLILLKASSYSDSKWLLLYF